jgi:hypothetical protein
MTRPEIRQIGLRAVQNALTPPPQASDGLALVALTLFVCSFGLWCAILARL